jgi:hypothetical protein
VSDGVLLLDCNFTIYVWIGQKSRENDKKVAMETTLDYASNKKVPVLVGNEISQKFPMLIIFAVNEGNETIGFVSQFCGWDTPVTNMVEISVKFHNFLG